MLPATHFALLALRRRAWVLVVAACVGAANAQPAAALESPSSADPAAPSPTLAQHYHPGVVVADYWVSEKYDGVRALWTGQQLISRQGLPIRAPAWFTAGWPPVPMDGELWAGRGQFAAAQAAVAQATPDDARWRALRYMVFDLPRVPGGFGERLPLLRRTVAHLGQPWVQPAAQWRVSSHTELMGQLHRLEKAGAEGLMLRRDDAPYRGGRSDDLLKLKTFEDAEAVVVGQEPGRGKYAGQTGALLVALPDGRRLRLGSGLPDAVRRNPPPAGTVVTYRFNGTHASGLPRFARFWRVRADAPSAPSAANAAAAGGQANLEPGPARNRGK
ncbi:DNA ligase [Diaphorobacter nitroreducens]|uniref:DNA ligase n=1 Tax=Diaphorobacter nitroreducens TaxID=164759 RepID=UPI000B598EA7|nr:DNA ligase [Diaphorobacter nitroreducens]ASI67537.1 DNA ligase [Diaphorobacter nitroreducens]